MERIRRLEARNLGPFMETSIDLAPRTTLLTGAGGSGKTVMMETAWWALTGETRFLTRYGRTEDSRASAELAGQETRTVHLAPRSWQEEGTETTEDALVVHADEDGRLRIWDPLNSLLAGADRENRPNWLFNPQETWHGKDGRTEGVLRDICRWQAAKPEQEPEPEPEPQSGQVWLNARGHLMMDPSEVQLKARNAFTQALSRTMGKNTVLTEPQRMPSTLAITPMAQVGREVPIPLMHAGAGLRRAFCLLHALVWTWEENQVQAALRGREPLGPPVFMMDLPEAHLSLTQQRGLFPAMAEAAQKLYGRSPQWLIVTHSPEFVSAVRQNGWDDRLDAWLSLRQLPDGEVRIMTEEGWQPAS